MKYSLLLSLAFLSALEARENPFFALDPSIKNQKVTSNVIESKDLLGSLQHTLPDQARVLKDVTYTFQNLDGSIEIKTINVDRRIDWHYPLVLTQSNAKASKLSALNRVGTADFGFIRFSAQNQTLTIHTTDPISRRFTLSDPYRIVFDFNRNAHFKSEEKVLDAGIFKSVTLSNHGKFVRATIVLDGLYTSKVKKAGNTITIVCK